MYPTCLDWAFSLFSCARRLTTLATLWAVQHSEHFSQHSRLIWSAWRASNVTMAAWLVKHNGRQLNKAIGVKGDNAVKCLAACVLIIC